MYDLEFIKLIDKVLNVTLNFMGFFLNVLELYGPLSRNCPDHYLVR